MDDSLIYYLLATISILFSLLAIVQTYASRAAAFFIIHLLFTAGIYAYLDAKVVALVQIILCIAAILASFLPSIKALNHKQRQLERMSRLGKLEILCIASMSLGLTVLSWAGFFSHELSIKTSSSPLEPNNSMVFGLQMFSHLKWSLILSFLLFLLTILTCWLIQKRTRASKDPARGEDFDSN